MKIPNIKGVIDRRILVNYTADPEVVKKIIPQPFTPKIYNGKAIVGICLIRLKEVRPKGFPAFLGISSENGAHRIAVEWKTGEVLHEGVYIPRRDTSSKLNAMAGGRLFPGKHYPAKFDVDEKDGQYNIAFTSSDNTCIAIEARVAEHLNEDSIFKTIDAASAFFQNGAVGYSPRGKTFDGLKLHTFNWHVKPLKVTSVRSSFFEDEHFFPPGSIQFDNALLMTHMKHEWQAVESKSACI